MADKSVWLAIGMAECVTQICLVGMCVHMHPRPTRVLWTRMNILHDFGRILWLPFLVYVAVFVGQICAHSAVGRRT
jgi:uncharacterized membrane protein